MVKFGLPVRPSVYYFRPSAFYLFGLLDSALWTHLFFEGGVHVTKNIAKLLFIKSQSERANVGLNRTKIYFYHDSFYFGSDKKSFIELTSAKFRQKLRARKSSQLPFLVLFSGTRLSDFPTVGCFQTSIIIFLTARWKQLYLAVTATPWSFHWLL